MTINFKTMRTLSQALDPLMDGVLMPMKLALALLKDEFAADSVACVSSPWGNVACT